MVYDPRKVAERCRNRNQKDGTLGTVGRVSNDVSERFLCRVRLLELRREEMRRKQRSLNTREEKRLNATFNGTVDQSQTQKTDTEK